MLYLVSRAINDKPDGIDKIRGGKIRTKKRWHRSLEVVFRHQVHGFCSTMTDTTANLSLLILHPIVKVTIANCAQTSFSRF